MQDITSHSFLDLQVERALFQLFNVIGKLSKGNLLDSAELHRGTCILLDWLLTRSSCILELKRNIYHRNNEEVLIKLFMNKHTWY